MALFRFPSATIDVAGTQQIAVRDATTGKFYRVTVQELIDLLESGGYPSIDDDGSTVTVDADLVVTGDSDLSAGALILDLPTTDPEVVGQAWMDTGVFKLSTGP